MDNHATTLSKPYPFNELKDAFSYRVPNWEYTPAAKYNGWNGKISLLRYDRVPTGAFLHLKEKLEKQLGVQFSITDVRIPPDFNHEIKNSLMSSTELRSYQRECLKNMITASKTGGLILGATGTGKTRMAGNYFKCLVGPGLFVVDELTLLKQTKKELEDVLGEEVGEIGNGVFDPKRITVGTIQTIHRYRLHPKFVPWNRTLKVIIVDELHLQLNRRNFQTIAVIQPPAVFGLTATLQLRRSYVAMRATALTGPVVFEYPLKKGVEEKHLSDGVVIGVECHQKISTPKFTGGNWYQRRQFYRQRYPEEYKEIIVNGEDRNRLVLEFVKEGYNRGKYIIILVQHIAHLKKLSEQLTIPHETVFGEKRVEERRGSMSRFEDGGIRVLIANIVFQKGINLKRLDMIIDATGMKSTNGAIQKYGRGVRLCQGKNGLIYIDIRDTGNRFEKAARKRAAAFKRVGVSVFKTGSEIGASRILDLAEKKIGAKRLLTK